MKIGLPGLKWHKTHQDGNLNLYRLVLADFGLRRILVARQIHLVVPQYLLRRQTPV